MWTTTVKVGRHSTTSQGVRYQYPRLVIPASVPDFALLEPGDEVRVKAYRSGKLVIELAPSPPQTPP